MRVALPVLVAASLVATSTLPFTVASAAVPQAPTADARAGADVGGEALEGNNWLWIGAGIVVLIFLLILLLDDDDEEVPVSP